VGFNVEKAAARLKSLPMRELQAEYARLYERPCKSWNRLHLIRRILWRLQNRLLSPEALARARQIAEVAPIRVVAPKSFVEQVRKAMDCEAPVERDPRLPEPGGVISRQYKGATISVTVQSDGFEWQGVKFPSLSAVAREITGSHMNGFRFFRLGGKR